MSALPSQLSLKEGVDRLIITVTVDSSVTWPGNPHMPAVEDVGAVAEQYVQAVEAGASICHHHGVHHVEDEIQPDGRKLSRVDFDGWQQLSDLIRDGGRDPIMQYGIASARLPEKVELMKQGPEMMAYCFNPHDEHFHPNPAHPPIDIYAMHPREELEAAARAAKQHGVKFDIECFYTGAYFNLRYIRELGLLEEPSWLTLFFNWPGATWTPPTPDAMAYMHRHLPADVNWNVSIMDPRTAWDLIPLAIAMGGHVRVGWEDNPYLPDGRLARSNAELVRTVVEIAERMGREVATPAEAREIAGLARRPTSIGGAR